MPRLPALGRHRMNATPAVALLLFPLALVAQREKPTLEWQKRSTTIEYGAAPVGKHTLGELPVGGDWRLGMNQASTWTTQLPIVFGDRALPPGEYRVGLHRIDEKRCAVVAQGSKLVLGDGADFSIEGDTGKAGKASKMLAIEWQKGAAKQKNLLPATLTVTFGATEWNGEASLVAGKTAKVGAYQLTVFALPAAVMAGRDKTKVPVAVLTRGNAKAAENWNLMVGKDDASLVPWMAAPTESFGFGAVVPPDSARTTKGKVVTADAKVDNPIEVLELRDSSLQKGELELQLVVGDETLTITVAEPPKSK